MAQGLEGPGRVPFRLGDLGADAHSRGVAGRSRARRSSPAQASCQCPACMSATARFQSSSWSGENQVLPAAMTPRIDANAIAKATPGAESTSVPTLRGFARRSTEGMPRRSACWRRGG